LPLAVKLLGVLTIAVAAAWLIACAVWQARSPVLELAQAELAGPLPPLPSGFLLGAATSAHQLDGGAGLSDWCRFEQEPGRIARGERSGIAAGHRDRVVEDVGLLAALGANAYRLSVEWARVEPEDGRVDEAEWDRLLAEVRLLRARGITPMVTLLHFTLPGWLAARGGLLAPDFVERFGRFAGEAARRLAGEVSLFATVNEPNVQVFYGYVEGTWPPGLRSPPDAGRAFAALLRAHAAAAHAIRAGMPEARVGPVVNLIEFEPASRWSALDWIASRAAANAFDWAFLDALRTGRIALPLPGARLEELAAPELEGTVDWIGVNYYTRNLMRFSLRAPGLVARGPGPGPVSDLGWEIRPAGLLAVLRDTWARYGRPLYVTENGIADATDRHRPAFLRAHLHAVARALAEGVPVLGYFHWSLLDNFEWADGFSPRFGLHAVDYATLARTPRGSAATFRALAAEARCATRSTAGGATSP